MWTQLKLNGSVPLPYDTEVSFVFQNLVGLPWESVTYRPETEVSRGYRVQLNASEFYEPRLTQLDLRFTKILQCGLGRARVRAWLDIFNVFNENSTSRIVANYTAPEFAYPRVSQVMVGRLLKFGGQFDW